MVERIRELSPEDQQHVDEFVSSGINSVERRPFRPGLLLLVLLGVTGAMTLLSIAIVWLYIPR